MPRPTRNDELPITRAYYDLILWLTPKMSKFPREHRVTLGERMERLLCEILEKMVRAKLTRERREILASVNVDLVHTFVTAKRCQATAWDVSPRNRSRKDGLKSRRRCSSTACGMTTAPPLATTR